MTILDTLVNILVALVELGEDGLSMQFSQSITCGSCLRLTIASEDNLI